jgi:hypothetical protein
MIRNLEVRDLEGGELVLGGAGTAGREVAAVAAAGFLVPGDRDTPTAAGVVYLSRDDLVRIHEWTTETLAATDPRRDDPPHSRACGVRRHDHGPDCHPNCPTCGGRPLDPR